ncbi:MAG: DUF2490 domain-containing protein [Bacteroidales bacterium]|nr:DUF2490 domain-containing protein [Bacteroidales bacterium]
MKFSTKIFLLILSLLPGLFTQAQDYKVIRDLRLYTGLGIEKSFGKRWDVEFETTLKLEKDATRIDELDFDLYGSFEIFDFLQVGAGYRVALNQKSDGSHEWRQRYLADVELKHVLSRFTLEYRARYQNVDDDFFLYESGATPKNILRNRLLMKYDIRKSKFTPYLFSELYGRLASNYPFPTKLKTGIGVRYNLKKFGAIKGFYRIDRELSMPVPYIYYTLGIGYSYDF